MFFWMFMIFTIFMIIMIFSKFQDFHNLYDFHDFHFARHSPSEIKNTYERRPLIRIWNFKTMHATQAGSTFSIFITFHDFASALNSHFDRHMGLAEFALSLVTCAQLSSWARTANTHGNIGCAFYASTATQNTPEQVKEA